jgi:hypothetical protein
MCAEATDKRNTNGPLATEMHVQLVSGTLKSRYMVGSMQAIIWS